jgi:hypothetical protein
MAMIGGDTDRDLEKLPERSIFGLKTPNFDITEIPIFEAILCESRTFSGRTWVEVSRESACKSVCLFRLLFGFRARLLIAGDRLLSANRHAINSVLGRDNRFSWGSS